MKEIQYKYNQIRRQYRKYNTNTTKLEDSLMRRNMWRWFTLQAEPRIQYKQIRRQYNAKEHVKGVHATSGTQQLHGGRDQVYRSSVRGVDGENMEKMRSKNIYDLQAGRADPKGIISSRLNR